MFCHVGYSCCDCFLFRCSTREEKSEYEIRSTAFPSCSSSPPCLIAALARTPWPFHPVFVVPRCSHFFTCFQPLNCQFNCHFWATASASCGLLCMSGHTIYCQTLAVASIVSLDCARRIPGKPTLNTCVPRLRSLAIAGTSKGRSSSIAFIVLVRVPVS